MFTLYHLIRLLGMVGGATALGAVGWNTFGLPGCVAGAPFGLVLGAIVGQLPLVIALKLLSQRLEQMTDEQLTDELHDPACRTPNLLLLELNRRGVDIQRELHFVQSLLASDEMHRRVAGFAALTSAFPELLDRIPDYSPTATTAECRAKAKGLLVNELKPEGTRGARR